MTAIKIQTEIDVNGRLQLEVPVGLPAGKAEVLIVVQPETGAATKMMAHAKGSSRSALFTNVPMPEIDATLDEMNQAWKSKLADLL